jgi:hypothetical protein
VPYGYVEDPLAQTDVFGLSGDCGKPKDPEWTAHGNKHLAPKNVPWKAIVGSTKSGPAKYLPGTDIEALERSVFNLGTTTTNGKSWKVQDMTKVIGASEGKVSQWIRVELSSNTIHGHPISYAEFLRLLK